MNIRQIVDRFGDRIETFLGRRPTIKDYIEHTFRWSMDYILYGCTFTDYFGLGFYHMKAAEKKTYHTQRFAMKFDFALDSNESIIKHNSKIYEYTHLKKYFKREQLISTECTYEEFTAFTQRHPVFFVKEDDSDSGKDIERLTATEENRREIYEKVRQFRAVLDEPVVQHPELTRLCPSSVNTIRVVTARVNGEVHIIGAALRMSDGKRIMDNYSQGGVVAAIDKQTGMIIDGATNFANQHFDAHPYTNVPFEGFRIPLWEQVVELVKNAGMDYTLNYVGWDVAVRENDCVLIEANPRPMIRAYQVAGNGGKRAEFQRLYKLWKKTDGKKVKR